MEENKEYIMTKEEHLFYGAPMDEVIEYAHDRGFLYQSVKERYDMSNPYSVVMLLEDLTEKAVWLCALSWVSEHDMYVDFALWHGKRKEVVA